MTYVYAFVVVVLNWTPSPSLPSNHGHHCRCSAEEHPERTSCAERRLLHRHAAPPMCSAEDICVFGLLRRS
ncbi:hypothetical protein BD410DRAFT_795052 [Rickenella mellea]|uniref:Uncharacterized protein n=1 Tax=Rickenella mellea TaxID=50990 RepID=A0A4Y7PPH1_9AGAM|nr:hypothetical protein BD410DRAFT_795052 [Rickenella mellea]